MKQTCKKIIIAMSLLTYLSTVQSMAMMMPAGFQSNHCKGLHNIAASIQAEDPANQANETPYDSHHCMACFAITDEGMDYLNHPQPVNDLQSVIKEFCSVALTILSPPPKRYLS